MIEAVRRVLVVGGGIAGMSAAIMLRRGQVDVDLIDSDPAWRVYGAGISITGSTLRALGDLGVLAEVLALGCATDGYEVFDVAGERCAVIPTPRFGSGDIPGAGGILRPVLHDILARETRQSGANVALGLSVASVEPAGDSVEAVFTDGRTDRYDLVIGADGIYSSVRQLAFPEAPPPVFTGQACWRLLLDRDPTVLGRQFYLGGSVKLGLNPVSDTQMYMFLLETTADVQRFEAGRLAERLADLMAEFGGLPGRIRDGLKKDSPIVHRPLEAVLAPPPWTRGRIALIGDAAHATTPQLSSGAGMAIEDALVLAAELGRHAGVEAALAAFMARRFDRCRLVVENSLQIGRLEMSGASPRSQADLVETSLVALSAPY